MSKLARLRSKLAGGSGKRPTVSEPLSEAELLGKGSENIAVGDVERLVEPTKEYLVGALANTYDIDFVGFKVRDSSSEDGQVFFHVQKPEGMAPYQPTSDDDNAARFIQYTFPRAFFSAKEGIGATVTWTVGDKPVRAFKMIERHYFRGRLLASFDFDFGFCIPQSVNSCEFLYQLPKLTQEEVDEIIASPHEMKSDSFYFVESKLVMHHKAEYAFE